MILADIFVFIVISFCKSIVTGEELAKDEEITNYDVATYVPEKQMTNYGGSAPQIYNIYNECCDKNKTESKDLKIPEGYIHTPGVGIHKFHTEKMTWNDARNTCIQEGAHLCIINNAEEDALVYEAGKNAGASQVYLGMHDLFSKTDWVTVLDQPLKDVYTNWCLDNPNNGLKLNNEHCGTYWIPYNGWNDNVCHDPNEFMCEINMQ